MGIKTTINVTRGNAIARLLQIDTLILDKNYRALQNITCEPDDFFSEYVNTSVPLSVDEEALMKWTDTMLADKLDEPLYRFSMFENYLIPTENT